MLIRLPHCEVVTSHQAARRATAVSTRPFFFATKAVDVPREGGDAMKTMESLD